MSVARHRPSVTLTLNPKQWKRFCDLLREEGVTPSRVIDSLIQDYLAKRSRDARRERPDGRTRAARQLDASLPDAGVLPGTPPTP